MRTAKHPFDDRDIDAVAFGKTFGNRTADENDNFVQPRALCRTCHSRLSYVAAKTRRTAHFRHPKGVFCPTKFPAGQPYVNLTPSTPDDAAGAALRREFRRRWKWHYDAIQAHLVPFLSAKEFLALLGIANEHRSWDYVGLTQEMIPYCLVLMADFPPWTGYVRKGQEGRKLWFRFWFEHRMTGLDDLWIADGDPVLHRASFQPPATRRGRPAYEDLIADKVPGPLPADYLDAAEPVVPDFVINQVDRWFVNHPEFE
ncbi:hypothetical protein C8J35_11635 [Rhizobium sp. PP-F2F-G38]|nr:hypothetical protein C8J35_11635 [Rhizobium sp. PP-F2F-G38]